MFQEIADIVPFGIHTSDKVHLGITTANKTIEKWLELDEKNIVLAGAEMIIERSQTEVVKVAIAKSKAQLLNNKSIINHFNISFWKVI